MRVFPQDGRPQIQEDGASMKLTATKHLHRELQRHYLMFRDYLRTQLAPNIGLEMTHEEWDDEEKGIKTHTFLAKGILYKLLNHGEREEGQGTYTIQSEAYDELFDRLIEQLLTPESGMSRRERGVYLCQRRRDVVFSLRSWHNGKRRLCSFP